MRISFFNQYLEVDGFGNITEWSMNPSVCPTTPAYLVFFKEYHRLDPYCKALDISRQIKDPMLGNRWVSFAKPVEDFEMDVRIEAVNDGFDYSISLDGKFPRHYRFGLAVPTGRNTSIHHEHGEITTAVSSYYRSLSESWLDQTMLDVPLITSHGDQNCAIFSSVDENAQFFKYSDKVDYMRLTGLTTISPKFTISVRMIDYKSGSRVFIEKYPDSEFLFYQWKQTTKRLSEEFGIEITTQLSDNIDEGFFTSDGHSILGIKATRPKNEEVEPYSNLLEHELRKYPKNFAQSVKIDGLYLCADIKTEDSRSLEKQEVYGIVFLPESDNRSSRNWILLNVTKNDPKIIHHEIWHCAEEIIGECEWPTMRSGLIPEALGSDREYRAEIFAIMMTDPLRILEMMSDDSIHRQVGLTESRIIEHLWPDFQWRPQTSVSDSRVVHLIDGDEITPIPFGSMPKVNQGQVSFVYKGEE